MGLNLSSLKNLSSTSSANMGMSGDIVPSEIYISEPTVSGSENTAGVPVVSQEEKIHAIGPKISLMKLKRDS